MEPQYRSLTAAGTGAHEATAIVLATLTERGLTVHEVAPGRISVARTRRPRWAVIACVLTIWLAGLGLLFLLFRRTESGELVVTDGPRGCVVTLPPLLDDPTHRALAEALGHRLPTAAAATFASPGAEGDDLDDRTVARTELPVPGAPAPPPPPSAAVPVGAAPPPPPSAPAPPAPAPPAPAPSAPAPPAPAPPAPAPVAAAPTDTVPPSGLDLRFHAGTVRVEAGQTVVLGRDPSPAAPVVGHVAPGDTSSVSKSHLLLRFDGSRLTVEDLGSTNGSSVLRSHGVEALESGVAAPVAPGEQVAMGTLTFAIVQAPAGGPT